MKTKRLAALLLCAFLMMCMVGCGAKKSTITGTIDDINDFMFVVTTAEGETYALSFEEIPKGLNEVENGDNVIVTYTGELSVVDPFNGKIISIEKLP